MADNALLAIIEVQEASRRKPMHEVLFWIALQKHIAISSANTQDTCQSVEKFN